jgi:uncharacterized protein (DUF4415 family)
MTDFLWICLGVAAAVIVGALAGWGLMAEFAQAFGSTSAVHGVVCLGFVVGVGHLVFRGWLSLAPEKASSSTDAGSGSQAGPRANEPPKVAEIVSLNATPKPVKAMPKAAAIPGAKETVTLRIDQDVLDVFQQEGRGWQERVNAALRKAAGKCDD